MRPPRPRVGAALSLALTLGAGAVAAAGEPGSPEPAAAQKRPPELRHLGTAEGLSNDSVYALLQDSTGYLWVATEAGLDRWDGENVRSYRHDPADPTSIAESDVNALVEDRDGTLWIGTWGGGLDRFDPRTGVFEHYRADARDPTAIADSRVQALCLDRRGALWLGYYSHGLDRRDPLTGRFAHHVHDDADPASLGHDHVWAIAEAEGALWVATEAGLDLLAPGRPGFRHFRVADGLPDDNVLDVFVDRAGDVWAGTAAGLAVKRRGEERFAPALPEIEGLVGRGRAALREIFEDSLGRMWIATRDRGLLGWDRDTGALLHLSRRTRDPAGLRSDDVRALVEDRGGNLWIGTRGGGASRLDLKPRKFERFENDPENDQTLGHNRVWSLWEDADQALWIGTSDGLDRFDRASGVWTHFQHDPADRASLPRATPRALAEDGDGELWVGTNGGGLARIDRGRGRFQVRHQDPDDPASLASDAVWVLAKAHDGGLWVGTGAGLDHFDPRSGRFTHYRPDPGEPAGLGHERVLAVAEDDDGTVWVGSAGGGLDRLDRVRGSFHHFHHSRAAERSLASDDVTAIHRDRRGTLWVGTPGGLHRFDPRSESFTVFTEANGLPDHYVYGILEDDRGRLWLTTNRGLARFDPATGEVRTYTPEDGLQSLGFTEGAYHRGRSGRFYVGGVHGFNVFDPEAVIDNLRPPPVVIGGLRVLGVEQPSQPGRVSYLDSFVIDFAALDFTAPARNRYRYRLEGLQDDWVETADRAATFSHLEPGRYRFRVLGSNNDGVWNEVGATLPLVVTAPLWKRTPVQVALGGLVFALAFAGHRLRLRVVEGQNRELERLVALRTRELEQRSRRLEEANDETRRFAYLVSHDLRSPLVTIHGFVAELRAAFQGVRESIEGLIPLLDEARRRRVQTAFASEVPEALGFLEQAAGRIDQMTRSILKLARLSERPPELVQIDAAELIAGVLDHLGHELTEIEVEVGPLPGLVADRDALERVLQNLLSNAAKYREPGRRTRIVVTGERCGHEVEIRVSDNGRGIAEADVPHVFEILRRVGRQDTEGEGMGLAYALALVRRHGGRIECQSKPGVGSTFIVVLPQLAVPATAPG